MHTYAHDTPASTSDTYACAGRQAERMHANSSSTNRSHEQAHAEIKMERTKPCHELPQAVSGCGVVSGGVVEVLVWVWKCSCGSDCWAGVVVVGGGSDEALGTRFSHKMILVKLFLAAGELSSWPARMKFLEVKWQVQNKLCWPL